MTVRAHSEGVAGRVARAFLHSRLTPLSIITAILLGLIALATLPREEEPQIRVPMIDVSLAWPGTPAAQVERQLTDPVEQRLWQVPGLEYLYSTTHEDGALLIARFKVGSDPEQALVRLRARLEEATTRLPVGARVVDVVARSIDDVPVLALTLWSPGRPDLGSADLRRVAAELAVELRKTPGVARIGLLGGEPRTVRIEPDPGRMAAAGVSASELLAAVDRAGVSLPAGSLVRGGLETELRAESPLRELEDVERIVVAVRDGRSLLLSEVAAVTDAPGDPTNYVLFGDGGGQRHPAVTLEVTKRPGVNATVLTSGLHRRVAELTPALLGREIRVTTVRDYGETAKHKSDDLIFHLMLATLSVVTLIAIALGRREAVVVAIAIPVTLALTLFLYRFLGYTLNRVTLFALIFSIGILVDDAIVVVENIARHLRMADDRPLDRRVVEAVDEVGNPTILATAAVIAAILPLAFVGGLMGPYMKPIPVGASLAMLFSLVVAFVVSPWAARRVLAAHGTRGPGTGAAEAGEGRLDRLYRAGMGRLLSRARWRGVFFGGVVLLLVAAVSLVALRVVAVKMLPFDNKSEFEIVLDLPPGTALETTVAVAEEIATQLEREPEVLADQIYAGIGAPVTFNGLIRHYDRRVDPRLAEIQVVLQSGSARREQSHAIARRMRPALAAIAARHGARFKLVEVPPGPPVLSTLVAEVYGPDLEGQRRVARGVDGVFRATSGVVDVDLMIDEGRPRTRLIADPDRAALAGIAAADVTRAVATLYQGSEVGVLRGPRDAEPVPLRVRLAPGERADLMALGSLRLGPQGTPISELARAERDSVPPEIHHKNLHRVVYVLGEVAGREESPVYAIAGLRRGVDALVAPDGRPVHQLSTQLPSSDESYSLKWDGEWHVTYEVFRDMGAAFAVVLVLIYILTVGWFRSFVTPLVIMLPIPLSLVGILPAHALFGAYFTATSMIGFIAGAGITVRNSIILVDFIELRRREGMPLAAAVVDAGAVRFRPMVLTAAAVVVGSTVILFDPIFQGLAVALIGGEVAATILSRVAVPVLYYLSRRHEARET